MSKRVFHAALILIAVLFAIQFLATFNVNAQTTAALKLKIYVAPTKVPADNKGYEVIFVQLQDAKNNPARASESVTIYLSSSQTDIGSVDSTITIQQGSTYAKAKFYSTYTPGTTTITATAPGFATVQASVTTVGPVPSKLAVYGLPSVLPADGRSYEAIVVQLQDASGTPARAPIGDLVVTLASSNTTVGSVPSTVTIKAGSTYATANFFANSIGSTTITAMASGYLSGQATIKTEPVSIEAVKLKVYVGPLKVPADGTVYNMIAIQLQDSNGKLASTLISKSISLSSSDTDIGTTDLSVTIEGGSTYALARFASTYRPGSTTITAAAPGYTSSQASITTVGYVPTKLAVFCAPSNLPADGQSYDAVIIQLQDSSGNPAKDPVGSIKVGLFSSKTDVGTVDQEVVIPFGETFAVARFSSTYSAGTAAITAQSSGYTSGQASMTVSLIDKYILTISATADPNPINSSAQTILRIYVTYSGLAPASGATVKLASDKGGGFSAVSDEKDGYYVCVFTAPKVTKDTVCTISINASKTGYTTGNTSIQVKVVPTIRTGTLDVFVKDTDGNPVVGANVTSISQPSGAVALSGVTDLQGYVSFKDVIAGVYILEVSKEGYEPVTEDVTVTAGGTAMCTPELVKIQGLADLSWLTITYTIVGVIIVVVVVLLIQRRR
ncbi:MAG: carboxypeptidase-like regulatory domain-containing protein [Candidatus Bathyarchaeota archaeon]|nr:carboxypeptidase-like regulatory domain-containing protein [Candidatus Bathyarchaeota archaeon]